MHRNTTDFCILVLYPANLLNSFTSSSRFFLVEFLGFSIYSIIFANSTSFTSSFPIWIIFISFSYITAVPTTSNTMLNTSGKNGHTCLVPDLRGKAFSFVPLNMILGLSYIAFIMFRYILSIFTLLRLFIVKGCSVLSNAFSTSVEMIT